MHLQGRLSIAELPALSDPDILPCHGSKRLKATLKSTCYDIKSSNSSLSASAQIWKLSKD